MSKAKANLVKVNLKAGNFKLAVFIALQCNMEGCRSDRANGDVAQDVYLDNAYAMVKDSLSRHQFAGYLAALKADGNYEQFDSNGDFGTVILKAATGN